MLTRDLVLFAVRQGRIRPRFLSRKDPALKEIVGRLVDVYRGAVGQPVAVVEESMADQVRGYRYPKVARGLIKLLTDTLTVEDPKEVSIELRRTTFEAAMKVFAEAEGDLQPDRYAEQVAQRVGKEVSTLRGELYADLPHRRAVIAIERIDADGLMNRYDLALAQGLVMYSQRLVLRFPDLERPEVRRMLRFMRFCRLVAKVERQDKECQLTVEGPAAIFEGSKGYGLQLASFMAVVPSLSTWSLQAQVQWPRRATAELVLTSRDGLKPRVAGGAGHVPEEMRMVLSKLEEPGWSVDVSPPAQPVGATGWAVPDFALVSDGGVRLSIELFHRFHKGPLSRRLDELTTVPDPHYRLGVERALFAKDAELAARVEAHPQVFFFRSFPSRRTLKSLMTAT